MHFMMSYSNNRQSKGASRSPARSSLYMIPVIALAFYGALLLFHDHGGLSNTYFETNPHSVLATLEEQKRVQVQDHCLGLGFEEDMDKLLSKYKQVFLLMPTKAAGTTFRAFTRKCMLSMKLNAFVDHAPQLHKFGSDVDAAFQSELKMPTLISSHLEKAKYLHEVLQSATDDTLIVYSHRQETNRLLSAIKHVITSRSCATKTKPAGIATVSESACNVEEGFLIETIRKQRAEIGMGNAKILTCETFESIKDNDPNLVFMNYKQAGNLQQLLAKHHCPGVTKEVQANVGSNKKTTVSVVLEGGPGNNNNGTLVPLEDWLRFKAPVLEYSLALKRNVSCQATTRKIERELFACADETLGISGLSHDGQTMDFPL